MSERAIVAVPLDPEAENLDFDKESVARLFNTEGVRYAVEIVETDDETIEQRVETWRRDFVGESDD